MTTIIFVGYRFAYDTTAVKCFMEIDPAKERVYELVENVRNWIRAQTWVKSIGDSRPENEDAEPFVVTCDGATSTYDVSTLLEFSENPGEGVTVYRSYEEWMKTLLT